MTLHDAQTRHGGDGGICPIVIRNIGIGIAGQKIAVTHLIFQKPEENGGGLHTGDQSIWVNIAIIVTDDIFVGMIENFGRLLMQYPVPIFVLLGFHFLIKASIVICYAHSEHLLQNRNSRLISFENQAAMYVVYSAVKTRHRVQIGGISSYRYYL